MTRTKFYSIIYSTLLIISIIGCQKDNNIENTSPPQIDFISPSKGQNFTEDDTIYLRVNIISAVELHDYMLEVKNVTENKAVYTYNGHSDGKTASINEYYIPYVSKDADMQLVLTTLDHNGNKSVQTSEFKIKNTKEELKPEIIIISPSTAECDNNSSLHIQLGVNHTLLLKECHVKLTKNGSAVMDFFPNVAHMKSYLLDTTYQIKVDAYADFLLQVSATDTNNIIAEKSIDFHVHY
jgi:hypothetical protein